MDQGKCVVHGDNLVGVGPRGTSWVLVGTPSFIGDAPAIVESTFVAYVAKAFMECLSVCNDALCPPHVCIGCGGI